MEKDKLVIELDGKRYAFDTADVASIVESERIPVLPGSAGFVTGIISLRGEPVTVVDLGKVFNPDRKSEEGPRRIVVVRGKNRILGFDIGSANISFLWEEELKGAAPAGETGSSTGEERGPCRSVDWGALFDETTRILST
jgi:chemotaxis signal transduction protein